MARISLYEHIFHSRVVFTVLLGVTVFMYAATIGAYSTGILTTIQREFQLKSSEVALLFSINDIVSMIMVTPIGYLGATRHRPRIIGILTLIFSLGCFVSILPQFFGHHPSDLNAPSGNNTLQNTSSTPPFFAVELCDTDDIESEGSNANETETCSKEELAASGAQFRRAAWFIIGQILCGAGSGAYGTLGVTYIDDGVSKKSSSAYVGILFMIISVSPAIAFGISALSLSFHTDFYKIDADELGYGAEDPRWIGAWWFGYLLFGAILTVLSIPFFFFPKKWPEKKNDLELSTMNTDEINEKDSVDASDVFIIKPTGDKQPSSITGLVKGYLQTMFRLATNVTFMTIVASGIAESSTFAGLFSFLGRYLQTQYDVTPAMTSIILGCVTSPSMFIGNFTSGMILKKLKLGVRGTLVVCIVISSITLVLSSLFFAVGCDTTPIAGINTPYLVDEKNTAMFGADELPTCINDCACNAGTYSPVCGSDGLTYITPCHAGCTEYTEWSTDIDGSTVRIYSQCSCVTDNSNSSQYGPFTAVSDECPRDCLGKQFGFLILLASIMLILSFSYIPTFMLYLRCVGEQDRAVSLGLANLLVKVLAYIPAPIYFGALIQKTCLMFQESCGKTGNCLIYDNQKLTTVLFGLVIIFKTLSLLMFICSFLSLRRSKSGEYQQLQLFRSEKEPVDDV